MSTPGDRRTFSSPGLPWYDRGIYLSRPCPNTCALWMFDAREALPCDPFSEVSWGDDPNTSPHPIMGTRCDPTLTISHISLIVVELLSKYCSVKTRRLPPIGWSRRHAAGGDSP